MLLFVIKTLNIRQIYENFNYFFLVLIEPVSIRLVGSPSIYSWLHAVRICEQ